MLDLSFDLGYFVSQVIFAIGASMIALSVLVFLPRSAVAAIALGLIAGHNLLDPSRQRPSARPRGLELPA